MFSFGILYPSEEFIGDDDENFENRNTLFGTWNKELIVDFEVEATEQ